MWAADTDRDGDALYIYDLNPADGSLTRRTAIKDYPSPSSLAVSPNQKFLYAPQWARSVQKTSGRAVVNAGAFSDRQDTHVSGTGPDSRRSSSESSAQQGRPE